MRKGLFALAVLFALASPLHGTDVIITTTFKRGATPSFVRTESHLSVLLPQELQDRIAKDFAGFRIPAQSDMTTGPWRDWAVYGEYEPYGKAAPYIAIADFNRDGRPDVVLILLSTDSKEYRLVVFHNEKNDWKPVILGPGGDHPQWLYVAATTGPKQWAPCILVSGYETEGDAVCWIDGKYQGSGEEDGEVKHSGKRPKR